MTTAAEAATVARSLRGGTRGDVIAAFGPATVIRFDSGYEVWLYRLEEPASAHKPGNAPTTPEPAHSDRPSSELVLLFSPSGVVDKVRVRSAS